MVTLRILDEEFDETIENISLEVAFTTIADYCFEHMVDEPNVLDITKTGDELVIYGDNVRFTIKDYYEEE